MLSRGLPRLTPGTNNELNTWGKIEGHEHSHSGWKKSKAGSLLSEHWLGCSGLGLPLPSIGPLQIPASTSRGLLPPPRFARIPLSFSQKRGHCGD